MNVLNAMIGFITLVSMRKLKFLFNASEVSEMKSLAMDSNSTMAFDSFAKAKLGLHTFSFIRHPFERLVSCYVDRVLVGLDPTTKWNRQPFQAFVQDLLIQAKHQKCEERPYDCKVNSHYRPLMSRCMYCDINYDAFVSQENYAEDLAYIFYR